MLELPGGYFTRTVPGREQWACHDRTACGRRASTIGQWTGIRVLRRIDRDGTQWTIRAVSGARVCGCPLYTLICEYRQHRVTSQHLTIEAAKAHCGDVERSWEATSLREYARGER